MPRKVVFSGEIEYLQILDPQGEVDQSIGIPVGLTDDKLFEMYERMLFFRRFDEKSLALQRTGRLGTYPSLVGQEAAQVGAGYAMEADDWLVPSFREQALMMLRGVSGAQLLAYWGGDEWGSHYDAGVNCLPIAVPVASQLCHAVGLAMSFAYRGEKRAVLACVGDGGTSEGDFHESSNFAGVFKAPVVFLVQNNQWAISVPRAQQTASATIAQKALSYGMYGIQVDGNDVMAMYEATKAALDRAREGGGASLIEAVTYRMGDHTTADDASRYRDAAEVEKWKAYDPLLRLERYLRKRSQLDDAMLADMERTISAQIAQVVSERDAMPKSKATDTFLYMYEEMPLHLKLQMAEMEESL